MSYKTSCSDNCGCTPIICLAILLIWLGEIAPEVAQFVREIAGMFAK